MKEKLTRNLGPKILSVLIATILWLVIANIDDPFMTKTFHDVKVKIENEEEITSLEQVYDVIENEAITFTVKGRKSIVNELTEEDFSITADLGHLSETDAVPIDISCPLYENDIDIIRGRYPVMKISREEAKEQSFKVNIVEIGEVAEGYYLCEKTASPNMIKISGPKTRIDRIDDLAVEVDITNATESFKAAGIPVIYDENGEIIDASKLTFSADSVSISLGIYKTKTINLYIRTEGEVADGYVCTGKEYEPKQIVISGPDDILKSISSLTIDEDITGITESVEKDIALQEYLPEGITLVGDDTTAALKVSVEKLETKDYIIYPKEIEIKDTSPARSVDYASIAGIVTRVEGRSEAINALTRLELKPYIDITGLSVGRHTLPVLFDLPDGITLVNEPTINFSIIQY